MQTDSLTARQIRQIDWTGRKEDTQYATHGVHPYPARMAPHIARHLMDLYSKKTSKKLVVDPFCGSGTVLVESLLHNRNVVGNDLNPLAVLISKVKTTPIDPRILQETRKRLIQQVKEDIREKATYPIPEIKNLEFWFKPSAISTLAIIRSHLENIPHNSKAYDFFRLCFSLAVRRSSSMKGGEFKLYRRQGEDLESFEPKPMEQFEKITAANIERMEDFVHRLGSNSNRAHVLQGDTRYLTEIDKAVLDERSADLLISSPPYGDAKTTVAYGQFSRYSSLWLGFPQDVVFPQDNLSLGGKVSKIEANLESKTLNDICSHISDADEKRAKDVVMFFHDADIAIEEITKVLIPNRSFACFVLANRTVKRIAIPTDRIFVELGRKHGLKHLTTIYREIPNKYIPSRNAPENVAGNTGTTMTKESIVIWKY